MRIRRVSDFAGLVSGRAVTRIACRHIGKRRNVDLAALVMPSLFIVLKSFALHAQSSGGARGAGDDSVRILQPRNGRAAKTGVRRHGNCVDSRVGGDDEVGQLLILPNVDYAL